MLWNFNEYKNHHKFNLMKKIYQAHLFIIYELFNYLFIYGLIKLNLNFF